jgi:hypothetical protein
MLRISLLIIIFLATGVFATQARVEGMGKRTAFFLDDATMFENPANATFYSSALMGELGLWNSSLGHREDPVSPWFGALFRYGLSKDGLQDPQITVGGFFGRDHKEFQRFVPREVEVSGTAYQIPKNVTNFDAFLAGTMLDGSAIGAHVYVAVQDGKEDDPGNNPALGEISGNAHVSILAMDYGANFLVSNRSSIELSLGIARIQYGPSRKTFLDPGLFSIYSQGRLFLDIDALSGQLVTGYKVADMEVPGWEEINYDLNVGVNRIIPHGMVWVGLDGVYIRETVSTWDVRVSDSGEEYLFYREPDSKERYDTDWSNKIGAIASFGIERNVFKDWLIMRMGGQKSFIYQSCKSNSGKSTVCLASDGPGTKGNFWTTNPLSNGTLDDYMGVGIGLNLENRLKIDATVAEDALFRNPLQQGPSHIISRIAAIYTF